MEFIAEADDDHYGKWYVVVAGLRYGIWPAWTDMARYVTSAKMYFSRDPIPNERIHPLLPGYLPIHPFAFINDGDESQYWEFNGDECQ